MKIRFNVYVLAILVCYSLQGFMVAESTFLMNQFRAPYSLREMLHDGLVFIQNSLDSIVVGGKENSSQILQMVADKLQDLENLYSQMYAKTVLNEIRRDERDFLQKLIDRIDAMIHQLEHDESNSSQDQELIKKNLDFLNDLKDQIGY